MSRISLLRTLCDTARKCVRNQVTAMRCTHIVDVPYMQHFCSPHFPSKCPHLLLSVMLPLKKGLISMGFFSGCEVCQIWTKLKISIVTFHKFDHFQCNLLIAPWLSYQIIQLYIYICDLYTYLQTYAKFNDEKCWSAWVRAECLKECPNTVWWGNHWGNNFLCCIWRRWRKL